MPEHSIHRIMPRLILAQHGWGDLQSQHTSLPGIDISWVRRLANKRRKKELKKKKWHTKEKEGRKEMFYLTTHSTHFIYGYMASDLW